MTAANMTQMDDVFSFDIPAEMIPHAVRDDLFLLAINPGHENEGIPYEMLAKSERSYYLNLTIPDPDTGKVETATLSCFANLPAESYCEYSDMAVTVPANYRFKTPA